MPLLRKITLTQYRNFSLRTFDCTAPIVGLTGFNGSGKTNLLDAIYYLCYTKSYFQSREVNNVQHGTEGFRIEGVLQEAPFLPGSDPVADPTTISCTWKEGKKTIQVNGAAYEKITDHIGKYAAVMIAPDDIGLINEGSDLRRKFMDGLLAQSNPRYLECLLTYQKYLTQRNAYLKQTPPALLAHDLLDVYDEQLALHGAYLIRERQRLSVILPEWAQQYYSRLSGDREMIAMHYKPTCMPEELSDFLKNSRQRDMLYRRTCYGAHTEDWSLLLGEHPLKTHASQGQKKSFLISLKLAHIQWLQQLGQHPFLLLDDIFEKLDKQRLHHLFDLLQAFSLSQIFLTHTDAADLLPIVSEYYKDIQIISL